MYQAGSRMIAGLLLFIFPLFLKGCGLLPSGPLPQAPDEPSMAMIDDVPFFAQEEFQCGPASLAMVLNWSGIDTQPSDLTPEVYSPGRKGSLQASLIGSARRHGRVA
ncbi:MAG: C39 family peptidase, partial [Desulfuromonadales bacterium]